MVMKLKAKIKAEHLDDILKGDKDIEVRSLESITLTDGKRTHTFEIEDVRNVDDELWAHTLPHYFDCEHPIIALYLGREVKG